MLEPPRRDPGLAQSSHGFVSQYAPGAAAIGHHLTVAWYLLQVLFQLVQGNIQGTGNMTLRKLLGWTHIDNGHQTLLRAVDEFFGGHGFKGITAVQVARDQLTNLFNVSLGKHAQIAYRIDRTIV